MCPVQDSASWFAVSVKPQHELTAAKAMEVREIHTYVPTQEIRKRWSDRDKVRQAPLFPGYVLAQFTPDDRSRVLQSAGVRRIVQFGEEPATIPASQIDSIRKLLAAGCLVESWAKLVPGEKIRIDSGPLAGVEGVYLKSRDALYLAVLVDLLGRSVVTLVDRESVARS